MFFCWVQRPCSVFAGNAEQEQLRQTEKRDASCSVQTSCWVLAGNAEQGHAPNRKRDDLCSVQHLAPNLCLVQWRCAEQVKTIDRH
jgi:hypothetical protein